MVGWLEMGGDTRLAKEELKVYPDERARVCSLCCHQRAALISLPGIPCEAKPASLALCSKNPGMAHCPLASVSSLA